MADLVRSYSFDDVVVSVAGNVIDEFSDGDAVKFEPAADDFELTQGSHGIVIASDKPNEVWNVTLLTMQGSPVNSVLSQLWATQKETKLSFSVLIKDSRSLDTLFFSRQAFFQKSAGATFASSAGSHEWIILAAHPTVVIGTNIPA